MSVRLVYETHSISEDNERGIATGWLDGRLSERGRAAARALGHRRRRDGIDLVLSSDLGRAVETASIAFEGSGIAVRQDARLRECDYGEMNGKPRAELDKLRLSRIDEPFPGGESYMDVVERMRELLADLARGHDGQRIVAIGHAATRFALDLLLHGRPIEDSITSPLEWQEGWEYEVTR